jgi:hypothetical protein
LQEGEADGLFDGLAELAGVRVCLVPPEELELPHAVRATAKTAAMSIVIIDLSRLLCIRLILKGGP